MPSYAPSDIRNIAITGHAGSGKTSLAEAMLFKAGALHHVGLVEKGSTASDFADEEKARGHSIYNGLLHCQYQGKQIYLIDTPGYADFLGQALMALPAVETVAVVVNAATGIEQTTRRMMDEAQRRGLSRLIIINKIDSENVDLAALLSQIQESFGKGCLPVNLPADGGKKIVDCFVAEDGESDLGSVAKFHTALIDQVVEVDEKLMEVYLEQGTVPAEKLHDPFMKALREGHLTPICFTAGRMHSKPDQSLGVAELLDLIVKLTPSPTEGNPRLYVKAGKPEETVTALPDPKQHVLAHVFQVQIDPFVGKLGIFRIHQGTVTTQTQLFINDPKVGEVKKPFKVGHLFKLQGKEHVEVAEAIAGEIVAVAKVDEIRRDAVLHDAHDQDALRFKTEGFPEPMFGLAITAKSRGDEKKISESLTKTQEEDPTFKVVRDATTHETVIYGLGELHLRLILEKLKNRYHVEVDTKPPKIGYRETILAKAEGHHRHKKQTGGAGQFGEVYLRVIPLERGKGFEYVDDTFGGSIPKQFIPAIEKGIRMVLETGAVAGYPLQDVRVEVYDGKYHDVDSKEIAFVTAGKRAFIDAVQKAKPALLEPVVKMEITVPNQFMGDIAGDLSGKRGRIMGTDMVAGNMSLIRATVPLAEVSNYQSQLKSVTGGLGSYSMEFSHFEPVPSHVQAQIVAQYKPKVEED